MTHMLYFELQLQYRVKSYLDTQQILCLPWILGVLVFQAYPPDPSDLFLQVFLGILVLLCDPVIVEEFRGVLIIKLVGAAW